MSTINSTGLNSGSTLTNAGSGTLHISGLANGFNYDTVIQAEMAVLEAPLTNMQDEINGLKTEDTTLSSLQDALQATSLDAQLLAEPSTFFNVQQITSSDTSLITAATTSGVGVPVGSTTVAVTQLAAAAQTSFNYTAPASGSDTLSISDGTTTSTGTLNTWPVTVAAGTTVSALAQQINGDNSLPVYAAVNASGQLVLSSRSTGSQYTISATDQTTAGNLTTGTATPGQDAGYTLNGSATTLYSHTDTVTGAIPGVTLNLLGVTGSNPVTITAQSPGPDVSSIVQMVQAFITDYNKAVGGMQAAINTQPPSAASPGSYDPNSGSLFGDPQLENLMSDMRQTFITNGSGLTPGMASLADIGITTGASTGSATMSSVDGELTLNTATLEAALASNPSGVKSVITEWAQSFQTVVNDGAGPAGAIADRISGNTSLISSLQNQYTQMQANFAERQQTMESQWAKLESTLSNLKSSGTYLTQLYNMSTSSSKG